MAHMFLKITKLFFGPQAEQSSQSTIPNALKNFIVDKNESLLSINPVFASLDPPLNPVSTKISTHRTVCQLLSLMKEKLR